MAERDAHPAPWRVPAGDGELGQARVPPAKTVSEHSRLSMPADALISPQPSALGMGRLRTVQPLKPMAALCSAGHSQRPNG